MAGERSSGPGPAPGPPRAGPPPYDRVVARRGDATAAGVGAGAAAAVVVTGLAAGEVASGWEVTLGRWAVDRFDAWTGALEVVMQAGTRAAPAVLAAALALAGWRWRAVAVAAAGWGAWAAAHRVRELVDRPRPTAATLGRPVREVVAGTGYPSTHVAIAAGLAAAVALLLARRSTVVVAALVLVPLLTALARLHLGVHWTLDVAGGAAVGVLVAALTALAVGGRA